MTNTQRPPPHFQTFKQPQWNPHNRPQPVWQEDEPGESEQEYISNVTIEEFETTINNDTISVDLNLETIIYLVPEKISSKKESVFKKPLCPVICSTKGNNIH